MKRILALLLATIMLFSMTAVAAYADGAGTLTISSSAAKQGDTITVTYKVTQTGVKAMTIEPAEIEGCELTAVKWLVSGAMQDAGTVDDPFAVIAWNEPTDLDADVYEATYKVKDDAVNGSYEIGYKTFICKTGADETDVAGDMTITKGTVTVKDHDHNMTKVAAKAPTCTVEGSKEYYTCSICNKKFADKDGATEVADADLVVPATGHSMTAVEAKEATCEEDGVKEACFYCENCKKYFKDEAGTTEVTDIVVKATGHDWGEWEIITPATQTEAGLQRRVCKNDETHIEEEVIPKLANNDKSDSILAETFRRAALILRQKQAAEEAAKKAAEEAAKKAAEEAPAPVVVEEWKNPFTDIDPEKVNINAIKYVYESGLFKGVSDTEFAPDATMTRAMFVTVLGRLDQVDVSTYTTKTFTDCDPIGDWDYAPYVEWAAKNGIVKGYGDGTFGPNDPVTKEQAVAIIARYARYLGFDATATDAATVDTSDWAAADVAWAIENDIVSADTWGAGTNVAPRIFVANAIYDFVGYLIK